MSSKVDRFIAYYRVSTVKQGSSGLGLSAQRSTVKMYLQDKGEVVSEFTEVESGRRSDRPALQQAVVSARIHRIPIVVAKVDRLTRSVAFLSRLLESGVDVRFADLPTIVGPTGRFLLQQMAAVAELEAGLISNRTKAALEVAKMRGVKLGGNRNSQVSKQAREVSKKVRARLATQRAQDLMPILKHLQDKGVTSCNGLARELSIRGIPTSRGCGSWTGMQVARVIRRHG